MSPIGAADPPLKKPVPPGAHQEQVSLRGRGQGASAATSWGAEDTGHRLCWNKEGRRHRLTTGPPGSPVSEAAGT